VNLLGAQAAVPANSANSANRIDVDTQMAGEHGSSPSQLSLSSFFSAFLPVLSFHNLAS
tara:strand:- start:4338 stop:4514 length:177 start_codon:yes stop_codon:yes gene_type:complete